MRAFPIEKIRQIRILVVGDVMLDRYWFGEVERISPEAPVPVVRVAKREDRLGGGANVARNIVALGGGVTLLGIVGDDEAGEQIARLAREAGIDTQLLIDASMHTTLKMRVLGRQQQLLRIDFDYLPDAQTLQQLEQQYRRLLNDHDIVVLSDYAKGVLTHCSLLIKLARERGIPVLVDPKGDEYDRYAGANLISPNRGEMQQAVGKWKTEEELTLSAQSLRQRLALEALLITRSEQGMTLYTEAGRFHVDAAAHEVFDVSGAGDTVLATMAVTRAAGADWHEAVEWANQAGGIVVGKLGNIYSKCRGTDMIIVTGAAGFIGSNLVRGLNNRGITNILAVDDLTDGDKFVNLRSGIIADYMDKDEFRTRVNSGQFGPVTAIFHQGACSDTTERNGRYMMDNNYRVTLELFNFCQARSIPFIYASSAAVYGAGPDYIEALENEKPLNVYGYSKFLFDQVVRERFEHRTAQVVGLRYFNVYGPNEQHKGRMASVAFHNMNQFLSEGHVRLFGGWDGYEDGGQRRDFISVDDVVAVNLFFLDHPEQSGIFNCGTGRAQPFNDIACAVVNTLREERNEARLSLDALVREGLIRYIPFPDDLKGRYQSFTQADTTRLRAAGFKAEMNDVEQGVSSYIRRLRSDNA